MSISTTFLDWCVDFGLKEPLISLPIGYIGLRGFEGRFLVIFFLIIHIALSFIRDSIRNVFKIIMTLGNRHICISELFDALIVGLYPTWSQYIFPIVDIKILS